MLTAYIYTAVIIGGAAVLALELLGTRVLAPFYGASLYLWSALIAVTLAALSVGYALGGRWADRGPRLGRFAILFGLAGLWTLLIPLLRDPVLLLTEPFGLRVAVLVTAALLFFPPLALLGMVSPYAIRLKAAQLEEVGRTAGYLYSVSTAASVAAALAIGFFLIPNLGVTRLVAATGLLLLATALWGSMLARRLRSAPLAAAVLLLAGGWAIAAVPAETADPDAGLLAIEQSAYGELRVLQDGPERFLLIDGGAHTGVDTTLWESLFEYVNVMDIPRGYFDRPKRMLLVGLGGGSVAKNYARNGWTVDVVEIDPAVTRLARRYFALRDDEARVFHEDGRQYLRRGGEAYDIIILDAFGSGSIPFHLITSESFARARECLSPEGVLAVNLQSIGWHDTIVTTIAATARRQFANVLVLPIAEPPNQLGNIVLLAADRSLELPEEPPRPQDRFSPEYHRAHAWDNRFVPRTEGVPVITDDRNPIDLWTERVNLRSRQELHDYFRARGATW